MTGHPRGDLWLGILCIVTGLWLAVLALRVGRGE